MILSDSVIPVAEVIFDVTGERAQDNIGINVKEIMIILKKLILLIKLPSPSDVLPLSKERGYSRS